MEMVKLGLITTELVYLYLTSITNTGICIIQFNYFYYCVVGNVKDNICFILLFLTSRGGVVTTILAGHKQ